MTKMLDRILKRKKRSMAIYEEDKEAFEKIIGKPTIKVIIADGVLENTAIIT